MQNNVIPFTYEEREIRVITGADGEPWWVAADVCSVLGHTNPSESVKGLDDDERAKKNLGRQGDTWFINEPGLYTLIIRSNKAEAKRFKRWITHDVLPSIRKNGHYTATDGDVELLSKHQLAEVAYRVKQVMRMVRAFGFKQAEAKMIVNDVVRDATGVDSLELLGVKESVAAEYIAETQVDADDRLPWKSAGENGWLNRSMLADFVAERCTLHKELVISATRLYEAFVIWYIRAYNSKTVPSQRKFGRMFGEHFQKFKSGQYYYRGIGLIDSEQTKTA